MLKILQINLNRCRAAHDVLHAIIKERSIDIVAACEPNQIRTSNTNWFTDLRIDTAIALVGPKVYAREVRKGLGYTIAELDSHTLYSCYISPNSNIDRFELTLRKIADDIRAQTKPVIIMGDFNAKSPEWGSSSTDARGRLLTEWMAELGLIAANDGSPTFARGASVSHLDLTLTSEKTESEEESFLTASENENEAEER